MELQIFKQEFSKMYSWFTNEVTTPGIVNFDFELHKNLWNFFLIGDSYYFIINHHTLQFDVVSKEVEDIFGYKTSELNLFFMTERIHPDDLLYFLAFGKRSAAFLSTQPAAKMAKYKIRYDIRYQKRNGEYMRLLYQGVLIEHDDEGRLLRSLGIHTDITYLKKEGKPTLSFIGMDGEPSYIDVDLENNFFTSKEDFTGREKEVLKLLIEGKLSKQIGSILHISKQTVDKHRKNMLHKKHLNNTGELVGKAIMCGWL